ncbi:MAG: 1,4-beta-N-acetylmuramidase [Clostridia bacterium]|nr:1,4-beta-N-acetylmuramidase [Clostridia bacterium]
MATKLNVIDVSVHQGTIDWDKVATQIDGAILRCGYGDDISSQDDAQFLRNLSECERLGIPHGVYLYSYADTTAHAKSELSHILRLIDGHTFQLPIYLDVEQSGTENFAATACEIVCAGLESAGYTAGVYSSLSWWNNYLTSVTSYRRWVAQWASKCTYTGDYDIWQYSESGSISGISGTVDLNYCYTPFSEMVNNGNGTGATATTTTTKTVAVIAAEVVAGKWGNGDERKSALTAEGYDYSEVQTAVNALMSGTTTKSVSEVAKEVVQGLWGNGDARKTALEAAGYDYATVQAAVNSILGA